MSELRTNKISPSSDTEVTLGDSGDTFTIPSGVTITNSGTANGFGGGGPWTVISSGTVGTSSSPAASLDITGITGNIRVIFSFEPYTPFPSAGWDLYARVSTDNGSSWKTGGSDYNWEMLKTGGSVSNGGTGASAIKLGGTGGVFTADIVNSASSLDYTAIGCNGAFYYDSGSGYNYMSAGVYKASKEITNAVQFLDTGGSRMHGKYVALSLNV